MIFRGDGACGKTSLLNVFTRGYVRSMCISRMRCGMAWHGACMGLLDEVKANDVFVSAGSSRLYSKILCSFSW